MDWHYRILSNLPKNWRQRLTAKLHGMLDKFDGRVTVSVDVEASPTIPQIDVIRCLRAGNAHAELLLADLVKSAAVEQAMRACHPELYVDQ